MYLFEFVPHVIGHAKLALQRLLIVVREREQECGRRGPSRGGSRGGGATASPDGGLGGSPAATGGHRGPSRREWMGRTPYERMG